MGLFDFFKKKPPEANPTDRNETSVSDGNSFLIEALKTRLLEIGYPTERHLHYLALIVNGEVEITTAIIVNPDNHPSLLQLMTYTIHPKYFSNGIQECLVGVGTSFQDQVRAAINNYVNTTFLPIMDGFSDSHDSNLDFSSTLDGKEVLWHPKLGNIGFQGQWNDHPENEYLFKLLKEKIKNKLTPNKFNWLKVYISRQPNDTIVGECLFNNEPWGEGLIDVTKYARSWQINDGFRGMKQFIMFRKCDAYD
jgi:hypothetical protein